MNIQLKVLTAAILAGLSGAALAVPALTPADVPPKYLPGPLSPFVDKTNLTAAERSAYAILEGIMQITEGKVSASDCTKFDADISIQADGSRKVPEPKVPTINGNQNRAVVISSGGSFRVDAALWKPVNGRGQKINVSMANGSLNGTNVGQYTSTVTYNNVNNMMTVNNAAWEVEDPSNGTLDAYTGIVIKDFYRGSQVAGDPNFEYYTIYDWGLQAVSKLNYPVEKWWQRSKTRRSDGAIGRTVWVKDRLVGPSACRITIDLAGVNSSSGIFDQAGYLLVEPVIPSTAVKQFTAIPFDGAAGTPVAP